MSSLLSVLASDQFNSCPDCKIVPRENYNAVVICPPCRAKRKEERARAEALLPNENGIREVVNGRVELLDAKRVYEYFYELWLSEMPYGIAKARDGDPYEWVFEMLCEEYSHLIEEEAS